MLKPLITIGLTCYNAEQTIEKAIKSALNQKYPNFEIIIVDDCSSDTSHEVIKETVKIYNNVRLITHKENKGVAAVRNTVIEHAKGDFIAFFDDDDVSLPERLDRQLQRIQKYEEIFSVEDIVCHTARNQEYFDGGRYERTMGTQEGKAPAGLSVANRILYGELCWHNKTNILGSCATCSLMARTKIFKKMNGYDEKLKRSEDTDFCIRFAINGGHFVGIKEPLVHQIMTSGKEKSIKQEYECEYYIIEKHKAYLNDIGWYQFTLLWLRLRKENYENRKLSLILQLISIFMKYPIKTIKKISWSLPAWQTRSAFKKWKHSENEIAKKLPAGVHCL